MLEVIDEEKLCVRAVQVGDKVQAKLRDLQQRYPQLIGQVRGLGAMVAMELIVDGDHSAPNPTLTKQLVSEGIKAGLILLSCGVRGNVIRFLPPLTIDWDVLDEGLALFDKLFSSLAK